MFWSYIREYVLCIGWTLWVRAGVQPAILLRATNSQSQLGSVGFWVKYSNPVDLSNSSLARVQKLKIKCIFFRGLEEHKAVVTTKEKQLCTKHTEIWNAGLLTDDFFLISKETVGNLEELRLPGFLQVTLPWNAGHLSWVVRKQRKLRAVCCYHNCF